MTPRLAAPLTSETTVARTPSARVRSRFVVALAVLITVTAAFTAPAGARPASNRRASAAASAFRAACAPAHGTVATCFARFRPVGSPAATVTSPQLTPADIAAAYGLPASATPHSTVAIVDAQDDPNAEQDLAAYRSRFHLPACTTANGCFRKVNETGHSAPLPEGDPGWGVEISLDLDAVSAACPSCHILLVEGDTPSLDDLGIAVNTAVRLGAAAVSNSYGATEFNGITTYGNKYYVHPGVAIVASTGDEGFGIPQFPAVLRTTIAVGGTSLTRKPSTGRGWTERVWDGASSGCSGYIGKPSWQTDAHCPTRVVADVSAVADPNSGFLVYDTFGLDGEGGWIQVGGTSLASPLIAAMITRAGNPSQYSTAQRIYQHTSALWDVKGGSNGYCGGDYLCTGVTGYDAPTGLGSPKGLGAL